MHTNTTSEWQNTTEPASPSKTQSLQKRKRRKPMPLSRTMLFENGGNNYMHFGFEAALAGESPCQVFQNENLLQHVLLPEITQISSGFHSQKVYNPHL
jgi:hypothetical protein